MQKIAPQKIALEKINMLAIDYENNLYFNNKKLGEKINKMNERKIKKIIKFLDKIREFNDEGVEVLPNNKVILSKEKILDFIKLLKNVDVKYHDVGLKLKSVGDFHSLSVKSAISKLISKDLLLGDINALFSVIFEKLEIDRISITSSKSIAYFLEYCKYKNSDVNDIPYEGDLITHMDEFIFDSYCEKVKKVFKFCEFLENLNQTNIPKTFNNKETEFILFRK